MAKSTDITSLGSGRTDAGVHALEQIVKITMPLEIAESALQKGLNSLLPKDIVVLNVQKVSFSFHPIKDALSKEYHYYFTNLASAHPHLLNTVANYSYDLDFDLMLHFCASLKGVHNFQNYFCTGTEILNYEREIFDCQIEDVSSPNALHFLAKDIYCFKIKGTGFLKQMVRLLVGALWNAGTGKLTLSDFSKSLSLPYQQKLGICAPAEGLYMYKVNYDKI